MTILVYVLAYVTTAFFLHLIATRYMPLKISHERNGIDILRGILAFFVFAGHSVLMSNTLEGKLWWPPQSKDIPVNVLAGVAVDSFFVITGFLFSYRGNYKRISIYNFYYRRLLRIYPAYALLSLLLCMFYAYLDKFNNSLFYLFIFATTSVNIDLPDLNPALYFHIWSLKLELYFYLILPIIYILSQKISKYTYLLVIGLMIGFIDIRYVFILFGYFFGANKDWVDERIKIEKFRTLFTIASICLFIYMAVYYFEINKFLLYFVRILLSMFMVFIFINMKISNNSIILCTIGDMSYSLYLCHGLSLVISYELALKISPGIITSDFFVLFSVPMVVLLTSTIFRFSEYYYFRSRQ